MILMKKFDNQKLIKKIKEKDTLNNLFMKDVFLFAYHIGDLDEFYFSDCTWFGLEENGQLIEVILLYTGLKVTTLLIFGSSQARNPNGRKLILL